MLEKKTEISMFFSMEISTFFSNIISWRNENENLSKEWVQEKRGLSTLSVRGTMKFDTDSLGICIDYFVSL